MITGLDPTIKEDALAFLQGGGAMGELIRSRDWRLSELGLPEQWPAALKSAISSVLNSGTAMHISWGDNLLQFYNDAYTPVLTGGKHPAALGRSVRESFPEIWDFIWPLFDRVLNQGEAIAMENAGLMMYRDGVLKESFFNFSYSPLKSLTGQVCGVASVCWETTEQVVIKRRELGLRLLTEQLAAASTLEEVRLAVCCHVEGNRGDLPFLLWYERDEVSKTLRLVKACGISTDAPLVRELGEQDVRSTLGQALDSDVPVARVLSLPEPATQWLLDPSEAMTVEAIAIEPLCYVNYATPDAYLVIGVGAQRPFDGACRNFHESIGRGIERAVRRISAVELERREGLRQFDAVMRLTLEAAQIGYWDLDLLTYTPKRSLQHDRIFGYDEPVADWSYERFLGHVIPQDREYVDRAFKAGLEAKTEWDIECRISRRDGGLRWIWVHGDVLTNAAGDAIRTLGIVIDITDRKGSENAMERAMHRLNEAQRVGNIGDWEYVPATESITWSPHMFEIFGRDPCLGPPRDHAENSTLFDDSSRALQQQKFQQTIESGQPQDYELVARRPNDTPVHIHVLAVPLVDDSGTVLRIHGTVQDISGRKQAEAESLQLAERLTTTLDIMSDAFFTVDRDWRFTFLNQRAELLLGRGREELLGRNLWVEFPTAVGAVFEREYRRAVAENVTVAFEEFFEALGIVFSVRAYPSDHGLAVYFRDVTRSRRAAEALRASEAEFRKLAEAMPQIVWTARADGWNTYLNQQWSEYTGLTLDDSLGHGWRQPFHPDERNLAAEAWHKATETTGTFSIESRLRRVDGAYRWWLIRGVPVQDDGGQVIKWFGTCTDIHDLKVAGLEITRVNQELRESEIRVKRLNRVYAVLSQINALIVRKPDRDELFREACRVAVEFGDFRFAWVGLVDSGADVLIPIASAGEVADFLEIAPAAVFACQPGAASRAAKAVQESRPQVMNDFAAQRQKLMKQDMEARGIHAYAVIPLVVQGEAIGVFALYAQETGFFDEGEMRLLHEAAGNISLAIEHLESQERLDYLAYYDPLTGLANRTLFLDRMSQHMRAATTGGHQLALFLVDLERFKNINDSLGRAAGDALLKHVADWMTRQVGDAGLLARVGPNHFAAVMPHVRPGGDLALLIEGAIGSLGSQSFELDDAVLRVTGKVGAALFPDDGDSAETLFQSAEAALRQAKAGGDRYLFHSRKMTDTAAGKLSLENQLRRALDNGEFVLHYQPKVNLATGHVTSAEALIRWNHPENGLVPPGEFIPVLEETGLIHEVGRWAMRQAIDDYLRWCDARLAAVRIAVNVSSLQLRSRVFVAEVAQVLGIDPRAASGLELEITESMVMGDINHAIATLQAIRAMGVTVALDDFGTGFSSLSHLARLPIDTLKVDRCFINDLDATPEGLALVSTIITLAHSLRHTVVAEGVETADQHRLLRLLDCDEMQGFHFGRPVPSAAFEASYLAPSRH